MPILTLIKENSYTFCSSLTIHNYERTRITATTSSTVLDQLLLNTPIFFLEVLMWVPRSQAMITALYQQF